MRRKSLYLKYFFSYLAIGIVPFLFGFIFYYTSIPALENEIERSHIAALGQAGREIDYITGEMMNTARFFSGYLENFSDSSGTVPAAGLGFAEDALISQNVRYYEDTFNVPVSMALFFRGSAWIYTSAGKIPYMNFEEGVRPDGDLTMSSFYTKINSINKYASLRLARFSFSAYSAGSGMAFLYPLPVQDLRPQAVLVFIFKSQDMQQILENYLGDLKGDIYLYNEMLVSLFDHNVLNLPEAFSKTLSNVKGVGIQDKKIGSGRYIMSRSVSENSGLSLVYVMKQNDFYTRIMNTKLILYVSVALLEIIIIIFAVIMSRRSYKPIRSLIDNIGGSAWKDTGPQQENEFDFILNKVNSIEETNQELSSALDRQRPMVAYSCLRSLLSGEFDTIDEMDYYLKYGGIDFSKPWFFVFVIIPLRSGDSRQLMSSQIRMILTAAEANRDDRFRFYGLELIPELQAAVIVNAGETTSGGEDIRRIAASCLAGEIKNNFNTETKIYSGRIYDSQVKLQASFLEAKAVMSGYFAGNEGLILFEDIKDSETYRYPVIEQSLYIQSVKQPNLETALRALDIMIDKAADSGAASVTQCLCFDIINMMMKAAGELKTEIPLKKLRAFTGFTDLEQFRLMARELTGWICQKSQEARREKAGRLRSEILDYVRENFCDVRFSLQEVADHFSLGVTYLSRFFKQETGNNFVDYVSMLRMDKVKEYLVSTDKQVKEIVFDVGYMDTASFVRKFRAREGITPGQYRDRMRK
ncbi:MAG: AraC family transcriptional regulator [Treponema sp.]|nr:AraC family transcriptional regulator [Treponema sp.]